MHPFNFVVDDYIEINTFGGPRRVSRRRYRIAQSCSGMHEKHIGQTVRLCNMDPNGEIGKHPSQDAQARGFLLVTLDDRINFIGGTSFTCVIGIPMQHLEPVGR